MFATSLTVLDHEDGTFTVVVDGEAYEPCESFEEMMDLAIGELARGHGPDPEAASAMGVAATLLEVALRDEMREVGIAAPLDLSVPVSFTTEQEGSFDELSAKYSADFHKMDDGSAHLHFFSECLGCLCHRLNILLPADVAAFFVHAPDVEDSA